MEQDRKDLKARIEKLEAENRSLRHALKIYADEENWYPPKNRTWRWEEGGDWARRVLRDLDR